jgi:hypothetical protein
VIEPQIEGEIQPRNIDIPVEVDIKKVKLLKKGMVKNESTIKPKVCPNN